MMAELNELAAALAAAQAEISAAKMDATNPFFKSRYASLSAVWDAIREPLTKHGISVVQMPTSDSDGNTVTLTTMLLHESGQRISSKMSAPIGQAKNPVQGMGSTITYLRRYALSAMVGVVSDEDDDGNSAQPAPAKNTAQVATYGTPQSFFERVQSKTGNYYKNIHHLKSTIQRWPDWTNREAVAEAGKAAIAHAAEKHRAETDEQKPLFDEPSDAELYELNNAVVNG